MAYDPPIGIPNPSTVFGWEIDRATPAWPASWLTGTTSATANYYYVDSTYPGATNTSNPYGHPQLPRLTPPEGSFSAGAFIYIHAGTYDDTVSTGDRFTYYGVGTSASPIWITGNPVTLPIIKDRIHIGEGGASDFWIIENLEFQSGTNTGKIEVRPTVSDTTCNHTLIRNCTLTGSGVGVQTDGISIGGGATSTTTVSNTVVYNCEISYFGAVATSEACGVYQKDRTDHTWVLDCEIHHVGADGVAGAHNGNDTDRLAQYYYIGRNTIYGNGENGIDLKATRYVVISQNTVYGPFTREQGWGIVVHSGATPTPVRDCWIIFNRVHHCSCGIVGTSTNGTEDIGIVGNVIYDIRASYAVTSDPLNGSAIMNRAIGGKCYIVDNTIYDYDNGIMVDGLDSSDSALIHGNVFLGRADALRYEIEQYTNGQQAYVSTDYNLVPSDARYKWANGARTLAYMQGIGQETNSVQGNPDFIDSASGNFGLDTGSPAIGVSVEGPVGDSAYTAFQTMFGESILFDFDGVPRPASGAWDMGALEYVADTYAMNITTLNATTLTVG